jgi:hypothetical protein
MCTSDINISFGSINSYTSASRKLMLASAFQDLSPRCGTRPKSYGPRHLTGSAPTSFFYNLILGPSKCRRSCIPAFLDVSKGLYHKIIKTSSSNKISNLKFEWRSVHLSSYNNKKDFFIHPFIRWYIHRSHSHVPFLPTLIFPFNIFY